MDSFKENGTETSNNPKKYRKMHVTFHRAGLQDQHMNKRTNKSKRHTGMSFLSNHHEGYYWLLYKYRMNIMKNTEN